MRFSTAELERAFREYRRVKDECSRTGDWRPFAQLFTPDVYYVEHAYGEFKGRAEVERYIVAVMAPFPTMRFVEDWIVCDEERGAILWQLQNVFPPPFDPDTGKPFQFPNLSRVVLAGFAADGLPQFSEEQDWYNPSGKCAFHVGPTTKAWRKAGGKFETKEQLFMTHDVPKSKV
jgi:hypothetical protein